MNPTDYSLGEMKKTIVSLIFLGAAVAGLFVAMDPNFVQACVSLVGAIFAVIGVFSAKNHDVEDLQKALEQLKGAALVVVGYFTVVPTTTAERITALVGGVVSVIAVYWTSNAGENEEEGEGAPAAAAAPVAANPGG
jgi:drug/metabolite transporter superfamily protein YnfA